jgi:hypothetical protein
MLDVSCTMLPDRIGTSAISSGGVVVHDVLELYRHSRRTAVDREKNACLDLS